MSGPPPPPPRLEDMDPAYVAESNYARMMGINGTFHGIALLFVGLRMYVRAFMVRSFGYDDALMIMATIILLGGGVVAQAHAGLHGALGRHADAAIAEDPMNMQTYLMMSFVQGICVTVVANCILKLSIGLSLLRLNSTKWYRRAVIALMIFVVCYLIEGVVTVLAYCDPVAAQWDKRLESTAKCYPLALRNKFGLMNTTFNVFTDVCFATIPIPMLWKLQTKFRVKMYLIGIFNLGYLTVGVGIAKMVCQQLFRQDRDRTFNNWVQFFGLLQLNVGIITACAPMLKPLVAKSLGLETYAANSYQNQPNAYPYGSKRSKPSALGYMRGDDEEEFEMTRYNSSRTRPVLTTFVQGGAGSAESDDGSETFILDGHQVMKKTEISVVKT